MKWLSSKNLVRSSVQLASDGRWEDAVPVESTDANTLRHLLTESGPNVAIESVYCDKAGSLRGFFGFRRVLEGSEQRSSFWQDVLEAAVAYQSRAPAEQLLAWLSLLGAPSLIKSEPAGTQLGVFNQWLSARPVTLHGNRLEHSDVESGPDWVRNGSTAPICREQYWMNPERIWVAETASVWDNGFYRIDPSVSPM